MKPIRKKIAPLKRNVFDPKVPYQYLKYVKEIYNINDILQQDI
jgi:hypothetical protein